MGDKELAKKIFVDIEAGMEDAYLYYKIITPLKWNKLKIKYGIEVEMNDVKDD